MVARAGACRERWRVVNTAKTRYFSIDLGAGQTFTKIGGDGGLQEYSVESDFIVLAPGERADLIVIPRADPGAELALTGVLFNRGYGSIEARSLEHLFTMAIADKCRRTSGPPRPPVRRVIEPTSPSATPVRVNLGITQSGDGAFQYTMNGVAFTAPFRAKLGETRIWTVTNFTLVTPDPPSWLLLPRPGRERRARASARVEGYG